MRKLLTFLALGLCLLAPRVVFAQGAASSFDPCQVFPKTTAAINISTATTTQLVAPSTTGAPVYVCGMLLNQVNGTGSLALEYGTGTTCGTGTTAMTGTIFASTTASGTTNTLINSSKDQPSLAVAPTNNAVCALTTGTIQQSGWITYVQQPNVSSANFFDPCQQYPSSVAPINFSAATEATVVTGVANTTMYVCRIFYQDAGRASTANTGQFTYGTKVSTACDTGATNLGGPISGGLVPGANATTLNIAGGATNFTIPNGNSLCLTPTQTSTIEGWVTYVQR